VKNGVLLKSLCTDSKAITKSIYYLNMGASSSAGEEDLYIIIRKLLILFSTGFQYSNTVKKFKYTETTLLSRDSRGYAGKIV
jgi:hypothetical protein